MCVLYEFGCVRETKGRTKPTTGNVTSDDSAYFHIKLNEFSHKRATDETLGGERNKAKAALHSCHKD